MVDKGKRHYSITWKKNKNSDKIKYEIFSKKDVFVPASWKVKFTEAFLVFSDSATFNNNGNITLH